MSTVLINLQGLGSCRVVHQQSGAVITTDTPKEFGGQGRSFSATDLIAAALGTCMATSIDSVALRHSIPLQAIKIEVQKKLADKPKRVTELSVSIHLAHVTTPDVVQRMRRASETCVVKRSLHPDIAVRIDFIF